MSLIGGYQLSSAKAGGAYTTHIYNFMGFPISGHTDSNALACCLYVWNSTSGMWEPMTQP
jgi:hypothetical protein